MNMTMIMIMISTMTMISNITMARTMIMDHGQDQLFPNQLDKWTKNPTWDHANHDPVPNCLSLMLIIMHHDQDHDHDQVHD
jgi:hypothetical protein